MIDALKPPLRLDEVGVSTENKIEPYRGIHRKLVEAGLIFASYLDITHFARERRWTHMRFPELESLFLFFEIPHSAFDADGVSAFTHVAVDHYADVLHATGATRQIARIPVPKRLERIAPEYAHSIHRDLTHILARPPTYLNDVMQSLRTDPTGASWLQRQIAIDERVEPSSPTQQAMMQGAVIGARKLFTS